MLWVDLEYLPALLNYGMNSPPSPQFWGSRISQSPPELGDLGGKITNNSDRFIFRFSNAYLPSWEGGEEWVLASD